MQEIRDPRAEGPGGRRPPRQSVRLPDDERAELERSLAAYTDVIDARLQEGMARIERAAAMLMRDLAAEVWRASGPEAGTNLKDRVLGAIARDDVVGGILAHTDERFQSLQLRVSQMEAAIRQLAEATRDAVRGVAARADEHRRVGGPGGEEITRQREELARFSQRLANGLAEMYRRIQHGVRGDLDRLRHEVRGEIQRLEAAVASQTAFSDDDARGLRAGIAELGDRIEGIRSSIEGSASAERAGVVPEGAPSDVAERLERVERAQDRQLERIAASERRLTELVDRLARGLGEVTRRIGEGFRLVLDRSREQQRGALRELEGSVGGETARLRAEIDQVAARTGTVLEAIHADVTARIEGSAGSMRDDAIHLVTELVGRHAGQQGRSLEAITESLRALLEAVRRTGTEQSAAMERVLRVSMGRQEAILDESLAALRTSIQELTEVYATRRESGPEDAGAFTRRLRGVEQRLERLSRELAGELS